MPFTGLIPMRRYGYSAHASTIGAVAAISTSPCCLNVLIGKSAMLFATRSVNGSASSSWLERSYAQCVCFGIKVELRFRAFAVEPPASRAMRAGLTLAAHPASMI